MVTGVGSTTSRYSDRVLRFLERVEHRRAVTAAEKDAAYKLRYDAYVRQGLINPRASGRLHDEAYDEMTNSWITTTFIDGELASTVRINVASEPGDRLPSLVPYSDVIMPHLRAGRTVIDPTRLAAELEFSKRFPELPAIALRPVWLAAEHFDAGIVVATIVEKHEGFYRSALGYELWTEPREYPDFNLRVACMGIDFRASKDQTKARYPFLNSTPAEREALFGRQRSRRVYPQFAHADQFVSAAE